MNSDGEHFTVGGTHYSRDDPNSYSGDIAVWDVTDRVVAGSISQHMFFEITDKTITPNPELVLVDIAYGFPFDKQLFAPGEMPDGTPYLEHICSRLQEVVLNKQTESDDKDILIFSRNESLEMDPNGMSGSPVFSICKSDEGFFLALRAMVLTSNGKIFRVVKAGNIVKLLENICAAEILSLKSKGSVGLRL